MGEYTPHGLEEDQRAIRERCLSEVDILNRMRHEDSSHDPKVLEGVHVDLLTATKEVAMPYAVSTTYQPYECGNFMWLDQNSVDVALSGYKFHQHSEARKRVAVEVDEALDLEKHLRPGEIRVFISPRMTRKDAPLEVAEQEHLAHDDMLRIHMLDHNPLEGIRGKYMQSLLVRDIPLEAWVAMLKDPGNIFGKAIDVEDNGSALPVMEAHSQLVLPADRLPDGVVNIVEAVIPYIADVRIRRKVMRQVELFRSDQPQMHETAASIADRWLAFEVALADSLHHGYATPEIARFIYELRHEWGDDMVSTLGDHQLPGGGFRCSRDLAVKLEEARRNTLWVAAAVVAGNEKVINKLGKKAATIYENELFIQQMMSQGYSAQELQAIEMQNNREIARSGVTTEGGCPGGAKGDFVSDPSSSEAGSASSESNEDDQEGKKKWMSCPYCKGKVFDDPCAFKLECWHCAALVVNGKVLFKGNGGKASEKKAPAEAAAPAPVATAAKEKPKPEQPQPQQQQLAAKGSVALAGASA